MLNEYYRDNNINELDLNCAEAVLHVANVAYNLDLKSETMILSSAFGGGMGIEDKCGALTASIMILGYMFVKDRAHESGLIKEITRDYFRNFEELMKSLDCGPLKKMHRTESAGCDTVIAAALETLESTINKFSGKRVR